MRASAETHTYAPLMVNWRWCLSTKSNALATSSAPLTSIWMDDVSTVGLCSPRISVHSMWERCLGSKLPAGRTWSSWSNSLHRYRTVPWRYNLQLRYLRSFQSSIASTLSRFKGELQVVPPRITTTHGHWLSYRCGSCRFRHRIRRMFPKGRRT